MTKTLIQQGAEAKIFLDEKTNIIIKDRIPKSYRLKILDEKIRKQRTKAEKNLLEKACKIISSPNPLPLKEFNILTMPYVNGKKLSEHLDNFPLEKQKAILKEIGNSVAKLHDVNIIHGDLTTSNLILVEDLHDSQIIDNKAHKVNNKKASNSLDYDSSLPLTTSNFQVFFIDFGLGFISPKIEDKAVDLHLLKQALEARHFQHWESLFNSLIKGYNISKESKKVLERLEVVEKRGRYKKGE